MKELKTKTITTDKTTLLVVECPKTYSLFHDEDWQLIGRLPDITEEQAHSIVDKEFNEMTDEWFYRNYFQDYDYNYTVGESLYSLLQSNEIYFENSIKHPRQMNMHPASVGWYNRQVQAHEEAQSKVWDKERTYIFKKI